MHNVLQQTSVAQFSPDGKTWRKAPSRGESATITKVVIGSLSGDAVQVSPDLWAQVLGWWDGVTHLHLWNLESLPALPRKLPQHLQCLDLRKCRTLEKLPTLPASLETLDLGDCEGLKGLPRGGKGLLHLHLDRCHGLLASTINTFVERCVVLEELTLSGCAHLRQLDGISAPRVPRLQKLVLADCTELAGLPDLSAHSHLQYIDVNECSALKELPTLPFPTDFKEGSGPQYLVMHGCDELREYQGVDVRLVHRGKDSDDNVAETIRDFHYLGRPPARMVSGKLLLLGSGRVGKTTLAKALQWASLSAADRADLKNQHLDPTAHSPSTHGVEFWQWRGDFALPDTEQKGRIPRTESEQGTVHIWDFGGQEIYHDTHRLFAGAGSVFAIVCTDKATHRARLDKEISRHGHQGSTLLEFERENAHRPLRYWLDYVRNALHIAMDDIARLPVVIVHSGPATLVAGKEDNYLLKQAGPYGQALKDRHLAWFSLDCSDQRYLESHGFHDLRNAMSHALGKSADAAGIRVPAFYKATHDLVDQQITPTEPHPCLNFDAWCQLVKRELEAHHPNAFRLAAMPNVTKYLDGIGHVFWLRQRQEGPVLIDQRVSTRIVYSLLKDYAIHEIREGRVRSTAGRPLPPGVFDKSWLRRHVSAEGLAIGLEQVGHLLEQCGICVALGDGEYQALPPELLPAAPAIRAERDAQWESVRRPDRHVNHRFRWSGTNSMLVGASDYQAVARWAARAIARGDIRELLTPPPEQDKERHHDVDWHNRFGIHSVFWDCGFQVALIPRGEAEVDGAVLCVEFHPRGREEFDGALYVQILTADEGTVAPRVKDALVAENGPLATMKSDLVADRLRPVRLPRVLRGRACDPLMNPWGKPSPASEPSGRFDVAISYRGTDSTLADQLFSALTAAQIRTYYYPRDRELNPRGDRKESSLIQIYQCLEQATCLVVIASNEYFDLTTVRPRKGNVYCPVELAGAVLSVAGTLAEVPVRRAEHVFFLAKVTADFNWGEIDPSVESMLNTRTSGQLKRTLKQAKSKIIAKRGVSSANVDQFERIRIATAAGSYASFLDKCGRGAKQVARWDTTGDDTPAQAIAEIVAKVKKALGKGKA